QPRRHGRGRHEARRAARRVPRLEGAPVRAVRRHCPRRRRRSCALGDGPARPEGPHPVWPVPCRGWGDGSVLGRASVRMVDGRIRRMKARGGLTLVELLVVLAIRRVPAGPALGGGLATLVPPALASYARTAILQAAARELATSINLGRQLAISRNTSVCVELASPTQLRLRTGGCAGPIWIGPGTDASGAI